MKKSLISLLILCFTCTLLFGCNSAPEDTTPIEAKDPIWGKGYYVSFNSFTTHSGHPSENFWYCLTEDQHLVAAPWTPPMDVQLTEYEFIPEEFPTGYTSFGYWQDIFKPEYLCANTRRAWRGQEEDGVYHFILLQLRDDMLFLVQQDTDSEGNPYIFFVQIIEEKGTQAEYFSYWNEQWLPRQFEDDKAPYEKWRELYHKYK